MIVGKWEGYFFDSRAFEGMPPNSKWNMDIEMSFENNDNFTATGSDDVGPFVFEGGEITGKTSSSGHKTNQPVY